MCVRPALGGGDNVQTYPISFDDGLGKGPLTRVRLPCPLGTGVSLGFRAENTAAEAVFRHLKVCGRARPSKGGACV